MSFFPQLPAAGPLWLPRFASSIANLFRQVMPAPLKLFSSATTALPPAGDYAGALAWNATTLTVNWSDGTAWKAPQGSDAQLDAIAGLTPAADQIIYWTGATAAALTGLTAFGRSLIDDADGAAARTTLGLGSIATQNANNVAITGGFITGLTSTFSVTTGNIQTFSGSVIVASDGATKGGIRMDQAVGNGLLGIYSAAGVRQGYIGFLNGTRLELKAEGSATGWLVTGELTLGTDLAVTEGGTGASTAAGARTNLGLATVALYDASNTWSALQIFSSLRISATTPEFTLYDSDTAGLNALGFMSVRDSGNALRMRIGKPFAGGAVWIDNSDDSFWFSKNGSGLVQLDTASSRLNMPSGWAVRINSQQVLQGRIGSWGTMTGTATRTAYDTATVTTAQLAERVKALIDDLRTHGLIGS